MASYSSTLESPSLRDPFICIIILSLLAGGFHSVSLTPSLDSKYLHYPLTGKSVFETCQGQLLQVPGSQTPWSVSSRSWSQTDLSM